ncbi:leucine-rich repeat domain-containing protein [Capnocytophaga sp.]|uniref:leucine-rich repeat domain-containing protein n=1 Tax=Capnocytophaga sp. TaxID=44737 RepID=UPI0026DBCE34|nr:leucine-rich repeat domain-containing protein [Capnocytophaga sp.]MDO5105247.1 leucine-rich repeat domain-containing protein [Capnocytophaga sp.]
MKRYFLAVTFLLFSISGFAQKKKKQDTALPPPIPKAMEVPEFEKREAGNNQHYEEYPHIVTTDMGSPATINITKTNGETIRLNAFEDLKKINFSELKSLSLEANYSRTKAKLEARFLQEILEKGSQLERLEIRHFEIESFPEIKKPNNVLKKLELKKNELKILPPSISNLVALEDFASYYNPLEELPDTFSQLKNLEKLSLEDAEFSAFPKEVFGLNKLSVLHISGNYKGERKIKEIPDLFAQLPELKEFIVTHSLLSTLPKSISTLKKLKKVDFLRNQFNDFPEVLASNPNLKDVSFSSNPLDWNKFTASIKKIKWSGSLSLSGTGFSKKQYEEIQKMLPKINVYYDEMND